MIQRDCRIENSIPAFSVFAIDKPFDRITGFFRIGMNCLSILEESCNPVFSLLRADLLLCVSVPRW